MQPMQCSQKEKVPTGDPREKLTPSEKTSKPLEKPAPPEDVTLTYKEENPTHDDSNNSDVHISDYGLHTEDELKGTG